MAIENAPMLDYTGKKILNELKGMSGTGAAPITEDPDHPLILDETGEEIVEELKKIKVDYADQKSHFDQLQITAISDSSIWEQGTLSTLDGSEVNNANRIRTKGLMNSGEFTAFKALENHSCAVLAYTKSGAFVGALDSDGIISIDPAVVAWVKEFDFNSYKDYAFRLVMRNDNTISSPITVSAGQYCEINKFDFYTRTEMDTDIKISSWLANNGLKVSDGKTSSSSILKVSPFIPIAYGAKKIMLKSPVYASSTAFGQCFYDASLTIISGNILTTSLDQQYGSEIRILDIPDNACYIRTVWFNDETTYGTFSGEMVGASDTKSYILIAAANSTEDEKQIADYVCDGVNDQNKIAEALRAATYKQINEVRLCKGTYSIDDFPYTDSTGIKIAIPVGRTSGGNRETLISIIGEGYGTFRRFGTTNGLYSGVQFVVSTACYNSLADDTQYAIIGCASSNGTRVYPGTKFNIEHVGVILPDNGKKIICIDGYYMSALSFDDVHLMAVAYEGGSGGTGVITPENLHIPVDGCIGVRGLQGSCYGINNMWENAFAWGFETGFQIIGEHIVAIELGTRFCKYGYKFGALTESWEGSLAHPNTLINCADELNFNLPIFGHSGRTANRSARQAITIIDYNMEWQPEYSALGGDLAKEITPGENYGELSFANVSSGGSGLNSVTTEFWTIGNGTNIKTKNLSHADHGSTSERLSYSPTMMQVFFDTTLKKMLVFDGSKWVDCNGDEAE